jgi:Protein of unknown function (DUF3617)
MRHSALVLVVTFPLALVANAAPTSAQDYPKLKAGQWETTTTSSKNPGTPQSKITMCTDDTVQKQMMNIGEGMRREMCSKADIRREGGKFIGDSVCKIGAGTMTSHSEMTVLGDTAYKTVVSATYDPPFMGMAESTTTIEGRNVGPCRDGLEPGDVVTATGQKFNMKSMASRPPAVPPATPPTNVK